MNALQLDVADWAISSKRFARLRTLPRIVVAPIKILKREKRHNVVCDIAALNKKQ